ncbi:MAG: YihY/virulence factor BrkB family protein [Pseudomonadota bacterium]
MADPAEHPRSARSKEWWARDDDARSAEPDAPQRDADAKADSADAANENTELPPTFFEEAYETTRPTTLFSAIYRTYEHSGFTMAGAVAFSFVLALFPFCIFVGALAGLFGGRELAELSITKLFEILPAQVAEALVPQVNAIMGQIRIDLITLGGAVALFFATNGIETLRNALNYAYREQETRPYPLCLLVSALFVLVNAACSLSITWLLVVAPAIATEFEPDWLKVIHEASWWDSLMRYGIAGIVTTLLLLAAHIWLAAGRRTLRQVIPGVAVSVVLWLAAAGLYSYYLSFADYTRFYAGLSQLMVALIFFQVTAVIIIVGAEINRGLMELRSLGYLRRSKAKRAAPLA